ncbi:putative fatty acyl-CoA reductase CG5065 [Thrips palmi]|uniref:Fatty acyl-CoA reductase n=1 Tax=Thrips palmi TaxID=161013 RepID=A0A6P8Y440_THRPL|nr:putative fatty acyl-CoA reductase CG5065 [Thrips palmi]
MDFTRCTIQAEELDDEESKRNWQRRRQQLHDAIALRDKTLGEDYPRIQDFYKGRHVFITGATGFIGKVVVEKLLRACPDIGNIYVLLRPRKGQEPAARLKAMMDVPLFDRLRQENPAAMDKVVPIRGDCLLDGLGIGADDRSTLVERVSVIIHSAASVRFTDPIKTAVRMNLRSTVDIVELARQMKNLKVVVHVSTAYCFTNHTPTQECVYTTDHDWRDVLKYAKLPDADALDLLGDKFMGFQPNSYVFTKALSERVMNEAALDLPIVIVRPSIVTCALDDPIPGWMDNLNGFAMFWAVASKGVLRYTYVRTKFLKYDLVPVDVVSNITILASWAKGTNQPLPVPSGNVEVVNVSLGDVKPSSAFMMQTVLRRHIVEGTVGYPGAIRYPRYGMCTNRFMAFILVFLYHVVFGTVLDTILVAMGRKPMLMPIYRKIAFAFTSLQYFMQHEFWFNSDNMWRLVSMAHPKDRANFGINLEGDNQDWMLVSKSQLLGVAKYALNENIGGKEDVERNCRRLNRLWWAELFCYIGLAALATWLLVVAFT